MGQPRARLGDMTSHGGRLITASSDVLVDGLPSVRLGDLHTCPISGHNVTPVVSASGSVLVDGRPVARVGDTVGCGATIIRGSSGVAAGG